MNVDPLINSNKDANDNIVLDFKDYYHILKNNKLKIISITLLVLLFSLYSTFTTIPTFQSKILIMIENENKAQQAIGFDFSSDETSLNNEMQIIKSRLLANMVIDSLINSPHKNNLYLLDTKKYKTKFTPIMKIFNNLFSSNGKDSIIINDNIVAENFYQFSSRIQENLSIKPQRDSRSLELAFTSPDPLESALILNVVTSVYIKLDSKWKNQEINTTSSFLERQLEDIYSQLVETENEIKEFQKNSFIFNNIESSNPDLEKLNEYELELSLKKIELNVTEEQILYLVEKLDRQQQRILDSNIEDKNIELLLDKSYNLKNTLINSLSAVNYDQSHDFILKLKNDIIEVEKQIKKELNNLNISEENIKNPLKFSEEIVEEIMDLRLSKNLLETKIAEFIKIIDQTKMKLNDLPNKNIIYNRLKRDLVSKEQLYMLIKEKLAEANITKASQTSLIRVIDKPKQGRLIKPSLLKNMLMGTLIGLFLSVAVVLGIEFSDNTIRSIDLIQKLGVSVIGVIPIIGSDMKKYGKKKYLKKKYLNKNFSERLITHFDPLNPVSEAYRSIRTNITYSNSEKEIRTIVVSSPGPSEGKTTTTINLAIAFSQLGKKTLLVDTDLRKPIVHKIFDSKRQPGISDYLHKDEEIELEKIIRSTGIKNLSLLPCGKLLPNPSELLGSNDMSNFLERMKKQYDLVIFDSPPIIAVTDARIIARDVDAMVIVVKSGQTNQHYFKRALTLLEKVEAPLVGCILNGFSREHGYYGDYDYYYEYYYTDTNKRDIIE